MPNSSNQPHQGSSTPAFSLGATTFQCRQSAGFALSLVLFLGLPWAGAEANQAPGAQTTQTSGAATVPAPPAAGFAFANLRPVLANVQTAISNLNLAHWKASGVARANVQQDVASMQRDLTATLPALLAQAEAPAASGPAALAPSFAVFRNLDALYDVLLRVTETAALTAPASDAGSLEEARSLLEEGRSQLGSWLLNSITAQDARIARAQAAAAATPAASPAGPTKIVVDDGPDKPKPHKKKTPPAQAPQ